MYMEWRCECLIYSIMAVFGSKDEGLFGGEASYLGTGYEGLHSEARMSETVFSL